MQIQVRTDNHIVGTEELIRQVESVVEASLSRFSDRITRVEVHLNDENSAAKSGDHDKRCLIEARLSGMQPISVTHHGASVDQAVNGAADKMETLIERTLGRLNARN